MTATLLLVKKFLVKRKCETMHCLDTTASSSAAKLQDKVFAHFQAVTIQEHTVRRNELFGLPDEFFAKNPIDVRENDKHALEFAHSLSCLFRSR
jgi:hypothetical protein